MLSTIKIRNSGENNWKLEFEGVSYRIGKEDSGIMDILKPSDNQTCIITDLTSEKAVCYFVKENKSICVYSLPDNQLRIKSSETLSFFDFLEDGVKYYLSPI